MAVSRSTRTYIDKGDFDSLENDWLARIEENAGDLDYFVGTARALSGQGQGERAGVLIGLLDEQLQERGLWELRLELLRRAAQFMLAGDEIHEAILATVRELYPESPSREGMIEEVGLTRAPGNVPKTWEKVDRLRELLVYEVGTAVSMEGRGAGRIAGVNWALSSFKVEFVEATALNVGFRAAVKLLSQLPDGHFLKRKLEEPDALEALGRKDPPALLQALLESYDKPLTAGDVRLLLGGLVPEKSWTSWWSAARKHPQVVTRGKGRQTYAWAETSGDAVEATWRAFERAKPRRKIALFKRDGTRDAELRQRMVGALAEIADQAAASEPGLAFEIWHALDKVLDDLGATVGADAASGELDWSPERLIERPGGLKALLTGIEDRAVRESAFRVIRQRRDDWGDIFLAGLADESDARVLDFVFGELAASGQRGIDRFLDGLLAQPHRAPGAFTWLAERAAEEETLAARNPLRLLQQILDGLSRNELAPFRLRLRKLVESGGTVSRLLPRLKPEQAPAAADAIHRAAGLERHERDDLTTALEMRFPTLRGEEAASTTLWATPEAIAEKRDELNRITKEELPANRAAIEEARAMGDLRENFEYKSARQRHEYLSALATEINRQLSRARPIDFSAIDPSQVRVGTRVTLAGPAGERVLTILGPWESEPEQGIVSYESDLAASLLGKSPGERVEVAGEPCEVVGVERAR